MIACIAAPINRPAVYQQKGSFTANSRFHISLLAVNIAAIARFPRAYEKEAGEKKNKEKGSGARNHHSSSLSIASPAGLRSQP